MATVPCTSFCGSTTKHKRQTMTNDKQRQTSKKDKQWQTTNYDKWPTTTNGKQRQMTNNDKWQTTTNDKQQKTTNKTIFWMHIMKADHLDTWTTWTTLSNWAILTILTDQWLIKKIIAKFALFTWSCVFWYFSSFFAIKEEKQACTSQGRTWQGVALWHNYLSFNHQKQFLDK